MQDVLLSKQTVSECLDTNFPNSGKMAYLHTRANGPSSHAFRRHRDCSRQFGVLAHIVKMEAKCTGLHNVSKKRMRADRKNVKCPFERGMPVVALGKAYLRLLKYPRRLSTFVVISVGGRCQFRGPILQEQHFKVLFC